MLIDTHAHLYWESFQKDFNQVIQRSLDAGVTTIINAGVDVELSKVALKQVENELAKYEGLTSYCEIAIHPHEAVTYFSNVEKINQDMEKLRQIYNSNPKKIVAIGECGLDYVFGANDLHPNASLSSEETKHLQKLLFQAQIELAKELNLPLVVHIRDDRSKNPNHIEAWDEVFEMVGNHPTVLHCYSGLEQTSKRAIKQTNIIVSLAGNITFPKNGYLREAVKLLPLEKTILETDAPFLSPQSKRGQRNEPANVKEIAEMVAEIKNIPFDQIANQTSENAKRTFNIR